MEIGLGLYSDVGMASFPHTIAMMGGAFMGVRLRRDTEGGVSVCVLFLTGDGG